MRVAACVIILCASYAFAIETLVPCKLVNKPGVCLELPSCELLVYVDRARVFYQERALDDFMRDAHCPFDGVSPKVCCPLDTLDMDKETLSKTAPIAIANRNPLEYIVAFPEPPFCGTSNYSVGGATDVIAVEQGDFPWTALLGYKQKSAVTWRCGGSLISRKHVLTAAHCIFGQESSLYLVRLGAWDLSQQGEGRTMDVHIRRTIVHDQYEPSRFSNDIGLILLDSEVTYTDLIKPICLPLSEQTQATNFSPYNTVIAGWMGLDYRGSGKLLQASELSVVSHSECQLAYRDLPKLAIDENVMCAGRRDRGACAGDDGGALLLPLRSTQTTGTQFYQIGVVAFGKRCSEPGVPAVFTRVTRFLPWLASHVLLNALI